MISTRDLRQFLNQYFSDEELESLCFDHFPEVAQNFGAGMTKNRKAIELIGYCERRGRLADLYVVLQKQRPSHWETWLAATTVATNEAIGDDAASDGLFEKTGIELLTVPAGPFRFGEGDAAITFELPAFRIGRTPVTNAQYKRFLDDVRGYDVPYRTQSWAPPYNWNILLRTYPEGKADHPVVLVDYNDAMAYCQWAGLRLPSEQEWEKAARGDKDERIFPWGAAWVDGRCNTKEAAVGSTSAAGRYSPQSDSPYGCVDMAGNVWEWTGSHYAGLSQNVVMRGGSWDNPQAFARLSYRGSASARELGPHVGFRVALS